MSELKPCPHGCETAQIFGDQGWDGVRFDFYISCDCGWISPTKPTESEAISAWNTRADVKQKWISVDERLPEPITYIFMTFFGAKDIGIMGNDNKFRVEGQIVEGVTHWCPIEFPED